MSQGILTKAGGPVQPPMGYLSKELDLVVKGWPAYLREVAAIALLIPEATKLALGNDLTVYTTHDVSVIRHSLREILDNC